MFALVSVVLQMCVSIPKWMFVFLYYYTNTYSKLALLKEMSPINGQHLTLYAIFILYSEFILLSKPHEHLIHYLLYKMPNFVFY